MCGRTACTLSPSNIRRACQYRGKSGGLREPLWRDAPCGGTYQPSANVPPTAYTPVLLSSNQESEAVEDERLLQPMLWGLIPPWHQGPDHKGHGLSTNNARLENVEESKLYRGSLSRRCVVLCDGFYEWKRDGDKKQPFLIYTKQNEGVSIEECEELFNNPDHPNSQKAEWSGPSIMKMAGLYSVWRGTDGIPVYNYTILTRESNSVLSWLHHRMPCFLSEPDISVWLNPTTSPKAALQLLRLPLPGDITWHPVSSSVGNVKNQSIELMRRVEPGTVSSLGGKQAVSNASKSLMSNWLKRSAAPKQKEKEEKKQKV